MPVHLLFGRLGAGKNVMAGQKILDYAAEGRRVVCNFPCSTKHLSPRLYKKVRAARIEIIEPRPTADRLWQLQHGGPTEEKAGLLVLDEVSAFLNSRSWNDRDRQALLDWFIHSRKMRWDVILIAQSPVQIDKQVREAVCEMYAKVMRMDRLKVPVLGLKMPRLHMATVRYGSEPNAVVAERWYTRGGPSVWGLYSTEWISQETVDFGWHTVIPPAHLMFNPITSELERQRLRVERIKQQAAARSAAKRPAAAQGPITMIKDDQINSLMPTLQLAI